MDAATNGNPVCMEDPVYRQCIAQAIRATAWQVIPYQEIKPQENLESHRESMVWGMDYQSQVIRQKLLSVAQELDPK